MGNNAIIIRTVGCHHNGLADQDAEQIAKRCVDELRAGGHSILTASVESCGGSIDLTGFTDNCPRGFVADRAGRLRQVAATDGMALRNPDAPARAAYERYLHAADGKSLVSGAELPGWDALPPEIKAAWMAAVDHTQPRLQR